MATAIELFGFLILTTMGLTVPVVAILLSLNQKGISKLAEQYEAEKTQARKNIGEQAKVIEARKETGLKEIKDSVHELEAIEKRALSKLSYTNPKMSVARLFITLIAAFCGVLIAILNAPEVNKPAEVMTITVIVVALALSLVCFTCAIYVMWRTLGVIVEAKAFIDSYEDSYEQRNSEQVTGLLSGILEKVGKSAESYFLTNFWISLDGDGIQDSSFIKNVKVNEKQEITVHFTNNEKRMAKRLQIGFIFPSEFIIEDRKEYSITRDAQTQIVRYKADEIQGHTKWLFPTKLAITAVKMGDLKVTTFIKGENIESKYTPIIFKAV